MKKHILQLVITARTVLSDSLTLIEMTDATGALLPEMAPGQFVEVNIPGADVLLNRPISIFDSTEKILSLLVRPAGRGTDVLCSLPVGTSLKIVGPLGHGFSFSDKPLLVGGGVGVAPFYKLARAYNERGIRPVLLYGSRTAPDRRLVDKLMEVADVEICTDDGTAGHHGTVATHPFMEHPESGTLIQCCGPMPMMKSIASLAVAAGVECEVSLENKMACGLGACLCCVEPTTTGNRCVCSDGPVFNIKELTWLS